MALTKVTYSMIANAAINVRDHGAVGDGSADDTAAVQSAITAASASNQMVYLPAGKYKITATLTVPASGYLYMVGETGAAAKNSLNYTKFSTLYFAPSGADDTLLDFGNNCYFNFERVFFVSDDVTQQHNAVSVGVLGNYTSQTSGTSPFLISQCSFHDWGGTGLSLGGEVFGAVEHCYFDDCTQAIAVNGRGEVTFYENHFSDSPNASFTPPANNGDAWVYIYQTVTRWDNNIFAASEDHRPWFLFDECTDVSFTGNKMEHPGRTALSYDQIEIYNDTISGRTLSFTQNAMTASSATGSFAGRFLSTKGSLPVATLIFNNNSATYSPGVASSIPIVDVTVNKPRTISMSSVYREASDNAAIKFASGADSGGLSTYATLAGLQGENISFITRQTIPFTISAGQTNVIIPLGVANRAFYFEKSLIQILPVSMTVLASASPADNVSFKINWDTAGADAVALGASEFSKQVWFPIRSDYIQSPDQVAAQSLDFKYTSGASASTAVTYYIIFVYALIADYSIARFQKFFVDAA